MEQHKQITNVRLSQSEIILPKKINAMIFVNDTQIASQIYIPMSEYIKHLDK